jgi:hypothetical protein
MPGNRRGYDEKHDIDEGLEFAGEFKHRHKLDIDAAPGNRRHVYR